jgi:hypothetical protein
MATAQSAISVLSALEGLNIAAPGLQHYVVPTAVVILTALFAVQPLGTSRIGAAFGPIMAIWFVSIGRSDGGASPKTLRWARCHTSFIQNDKFGFFPPSCRFGP